MEEKYTQLAKEGKFDELPDICEFSEYVELEVWDDNDVFKKIRRITGKYKGYYMDINHVGWNYAQLLKPKIDFSQFKIGDVVEVECYGDKGCENIVGYIYELNDYSINISIRMSYLGDYEIISKQNIKSITKIK